MWKKWRPAERVVLAAALFVLLLVVVYPVVVLLWQSTSSPEGFSLHRYREIFTTDRQVRLFGKTLALSGWVVVATLLLGVPYAFIVNKLNIPLRRLLVVLGFVPLLLPPHLQAVAWVELYIKASSKWTELPLDIYSVVGSIFAEALAYFPLVYLLLFFGLRSLDRTLEEAAYLCRGTFRALTGVVFPLVLPYVSTGAIFVFLFALSNFGVPGLLRVQVFAVEILFQLASYADIPKATALAVPFLALGTAAVLLQWAVEHRMRHGGAANYATPPRIYEVGLWKWPLTVFALAVALATSLLPLAILVKNAGGSAVYLYALQAGYRDILNSLMLSVMAATLTALLGALVACIIRNADPVSQRALDCLALLPFALPPSLLGIQLILIWNQGLLAQFFYGTVLMVVIAFFTRFVTFPIKILSAGMRQFDRYLEDAARLADLSGWKNLWLLLSMNSRTFWASWILVYILVQGELGINLLIDPPGFATLTTRIFNLFHYGRIDVISALSVWSIALLFVPFAAYLIFQRKGLRHL